MTDPQVLIQDAGDGVRVVLLNRPEVLNAMTASLASEYARTMRRLDADPDVRALVVSGAGRGFCAGADLGLLGGDLDELRRAVPVRGDLPSAALAPSTPVIAAANGPVAGIGLAYLLGSDIRFADPNAKIAVAFPRLGLVAEYGLSWIITRLVGLATASELLISGRTLTGEEAARLGLVHRVSAAGQALAEAVEYAREIALNCSAWSVTMIKSQLAADVHADYEAALARSLNLMDASFARDELRSRLASRPSRATTTGSDARGA